MNSPINNSTLGGCGSCKYKNVAYDKEPCCNCRLSKARSSEEYQTAPLLWEPIAEMVSDNVNHPSHYETGKFECIDVMIETQGVEAVKAFCLCNAFKYLYRHKNKNGVEDVKKAIWYLNKFIELE